MLFTDFADLEDVLEVEEDVVLLCFVSYFANAVLSWASDASDKSQIKVFPFKAQAIFLNVLKCVSSVLWLEEEKVSLVKDFCLFR